MAAFLDVCRFTPTAGGTTDWTYSAAVTGYQSPTAATVVNGRLYKYRAESADLTQWEVGEGAYNTGTGVLARTTVLFNSSGGTSKINFTLAPQVAIVALKEDLISVEEANAFTTAQKKQAQSNIFVAPTTQSLTSGSGATYTTPAGCMWIEVFMVGGGGGGAGAANSGTTVVDGSAGAGSVFSLWTAAGGSGSVGAAGGAGGSGGGGTATRRARGGVGKSTVDPTLATTTRSSSGAGGDSYFGGGAAAVSPNNAGNAADANSGAGGSGAANATGTTALAGGGGGAGEFVYLLLTSLSATYTYTIGAGGAGGISTSNGGVGASGFIFVVEHYGS